MDKQELISLVKDEAKLLREKATQEERNKLNYLQFNPAKPSRCIYGLMTGRCTTERAHQLIDQCASKLLVQPYSCAELDLCTINGKHSLKGNYRSLGGELAYFSPIECFIWFEQNQENGNNKLLIDYIKGEVEELNFNPF